MSQKPLSRAALAVLGMLVIAATGTAAASGRHPPARPVFAQRGSASAVEHILAPGRYDSGASKLDSGLVEVASGAGPRGVSPLKTINSTGLSRSRDGKVRVVIEARRPGEARASVARLGGRVESTWQNLVQAAVPAGALSELSRLPSVDRVRLPFRMVEQSINGEEVATSLASAWHAKNFTGKGVKIAVIDAGFQGLPQRQAEGELPTNVVTADYCGGHFADATEHGTAVAEIVHEMAPDAQLYLLCIDTEVDLADAEAFAKSQGVQIVNHSIGWFGPDRDDGSGPIGAIVSDARANGILWVNAAGNEAQTHWSGTFVSADGDRWLDFAPGDEGNSFLLPAGGAICGFLKWDEWPAAASDLDLALALSGSNQIVAASTAYQSGTQPPFEGLCVENNGPTVAVYWAINAYRLVGDPRLDLFSLSPPLQYETAAGSVTDPATSTAALAVGALCWQTKGLEFYSSQGPTIDGRTKPDIAGHDSVSGATYGPFAGCVSGFAGTSAASPEVAGAAALVKQAFPSYGPDQLQKFLQQSAKDIGAPGMDNATGAGMLQLPTPPDVVAPVSRALASSGKRGGIVALKSQGSDDSGQVRLREQVFRNRQLIATLQTKFAAAKAPRIFVTGWKSPKKAKGVFKHCSKAIDKAGNTSGTSCAPIALR